MNDSFISEGQFNPEDNFGASQTDENTNGFSDSESAEHITNVPCENNGYGCVLPVELRPDPKIVAESQQANKVSESNLIIKSVALPAVCECTNSDPIGSSFESAVSESGENITNVPCADIPKQEDDGYGTILDFQSTPNFSDGITGNIIPFGVPNTDPSVEDIEQPGSIAATETQVERPSLRLKNANKEIIQSAQFRLIFPIDKEEHEWFNSWTKINNPEFPEASEIFRQIIYNHAYTYHTTKPFVSLDELTAFTTSDFPTIVAVIRKLREKGGLAEIGIMVLLANLVDYIIRHGIGRIQSESYFFKHFSAQMGMSPSKGRDYVKRGRIFLEYREEILNGVEDVPGISLITLASSCLAKLTLFENAVNRHGLKQALKNLKELSFREFKKTLAYSEDDGKKEPKKPPVTDKKKADDLISQQEAYKAELKELNLMPNEKRLLRLVARGARYVCAPRMLTEKEVDLIESRLRERRLEILRREYNYRCANRNQDPFDPKHPITFSKDLYEITDFNEVVLRIRSCINLLQPMRRLIAILLFRLYSEKPWFGHKWKNPRDGVKYKSFRDFAMEELGMGEDYRDYLTVGKVIKEHYYFPDYLEDVDTESTFLKLRYLPAALRTHQNNEPLVLARLRSLTVREFKLFSIFADYETAFIKRLTEKHMDKFCNSLQCLRKPISGEPISDDYIESYGAYDDYYVREVINDVICHEPISSAVDEPETSDQIAEASDLGTHEAFDGNANQLDLLPTA